MNKHLINSLLLLLKPLIGILNRNGIAFGDFSRLAKQAYIQETEKELIKSGEKPTTAKIAIITGLTRKDVASLRKNAVPMLKPNPQKNRAVRVLSGWITDSAFSNKKGAPKELPIKGKTNSFEALVARYSGDMPYKSMLQELIRIGSVEKTGDDKVKLLRSVYIPSKEEAAKYTTLGDDVSLLISTIKHNILEVEQPSRYQRKVCYDQIPAKYITEFRQLADERSQQLLEELNDWLAQHDLDRHPDLKADKPMKIGLGIYYFEEETQNKEDTHHEN